MVFTRWIGRSVSRKFATAYVSLGLVIFALHALVVTTREATQIERAEREDLGALGVALARSTSEVWRLAGRDAALDVLASPRFDVRIRHVPVGEPPAGEGASVVIPLPLPASGALELTRERPKLLGLLTGDALEHVIAIGLFTLSTALLTAWLGRSLVVVPLARTIERARRIGRGEFSAERVGPRGNDELEQLEAALDDMCGELERAHARTRAEANARMEAVEALRHADRLRAVGQLAAGLAHELGTPLNVVLLLARKIVTGGVEPDASRARGIEEATRRISHLVRRLLDFARRRRPSVGRVRARNLLCSVDRMLAPAAESRQCRIVVVTGADVELEADGAALEQALVNLVMNALDASRTGGVVTLATEADEAGVVLSVCDEGHGMSEDVRRRVFEPFFTTKDVGAGTGLGLSLVLGIVEDHGGRVEVTSEVGVGSCFRLRLPRHPSTVAGLEPA